jgi:hypothetical protein
MRSNGGTAAKACTLSSVATRAIPPSGNAMCRKGSIWVATCSPNTGDEHASGAPSDSLIAGVGRLHKSTISAFAISLARSQRRMTSRREVMDGRER